VSARIAMHEHSMQKVFWSYHKLAETEVLQNGDRVRSWFRNFLKFFWDHPATAYSDKRFLQYRLNKDSSGSIQILVINILLLLLAVYAVAQKHVWPERGELDPAFNGYHGTLVEMGIWIVLSLLCLCYQLVLALYPSLFGMMFISSECEMWYEVAAAVLATRFLSGVMLVVNMTSSADRCMDSADLIGSQDRTFGYMFIEMVVGTSQALAFALLPFPQPWTVFFSLQELIRQELRLWSCADRITADPGDRWIVQLASLVLLFVYLVMIALPSVYMENCARSRYKLALQQRTVDAAKRDMVGFLSSDVRMPLQCLFHAMATVDIIQGEANATHVTDTLCTLSKTAVEVTDDLLLLLRVQEGCFSTSRTAVPDLHALLDSAVRSQCSIHETTNAHGARLSTQMDEPSVSLLIPTDLSITVDTRCLLAVVRHMLAFVQQQSSDVAVTDGWADPTLTEAVNDALHRQCGAGSEVGLSGSVKAVAVRGPGPSHLLTVVLSCNPPVSNRWSPAQRRHEATTAYLCSAAAVRCGGGFVAERGRYTLTLPCDATLSAIQSRAARLQSSRSMDTNDGMSLFANDDASAMDSVAPHSVHSNGSGLRPVPSLLALDRAELEERIHKSVGMQNRFRRHRVCVIAADEVLGTVVVAMVRRLHLDEGLSCLRTLQAGSYVPVAKLTFVCTLADAIELRAREYTGRIILISGELSYLGDEQLRCANYCLPLPCSDPHVAHFVDWLVGEHREETRQAAALERSSAADGVSHTQRTVGRRNSLGSNIALPQVVNGYHYDDINRADPLYVLLLPGRLCLQLVLVAWARAQDLARGLSGSLFVRRLPPGTVEGYYQWRLLNPARTWYHHSTERWLTVLLCLLLSVMLELYMDRQPSNGAVFLVLVQVLYLLPGCVFQYALRPLGGHISICWACVSVLMPAYYAMLVYEGAVATASSQRNLTLGAFLHSEFYEGRSGAEYLYSEIVTAALSRLYCMHNAYPLSVATMLLIFVRLTQVNYLVLRTMLSAQMTQFVQVAIVQLAVHNIVYLIHAEDARRTEFMTAHENIMTTATLNQCDNVCQQELRRSLEVLVQAQREFTELLVDAAVARKLLLDRALLRRLEPLHVSRVLLAEAVNELDCARSSNTRPTVQLGATEPVMLTRAVAEIISSLSSAAEDHYIKIYAEVDPRLTVLQTDWRALSAVLTNLIHQAIRNIQQFCLDAPRNRDLVNHILVKFTALDNPGLVRVPFAASRTLLLNVCDSSDAAIKALNAAEAQRSDPDLHRSDDSVSSLRGPHPHGYGRSICENFVRAVTAPGAESVFQTISVDVPLPTVQRLTYPYFLTPESRAAREFVEAETDRPFLTVMPCVSDYLASYRRIFRIDPPKKGAQAGTSSLSQQHQPPAAATDTTGHSRQLIFFSGAEAAQRGELGHLVKRFDAAGWTCTVKYILSVPSMHSVAGMDCVLIDQQLEVQEGVGVCSIVLKLRACGYNGVVAVLLQEGLKGFRTIREQLERSAAKADIVLLAPMADAHIEKLTATLERKCASQVIHMNGN
jgi:hypothetical protein